MSNNIGSRAPTLRLSLKLSLGDKEFEGQKIVRPSKDHPDEIFPFEFEGGRVEIKISKLGNTQAWMERKRANS